MSRAASFVSTLALMPCTAHVETLTSKLHRLHKLTSHFRSAVTEHLESHLLHAHNEDARRGAHDSRDSRANAAGAPGTS